LNPLAGKKFTPSPRLAKWTVGDDYETYDWSEEPKIDAKSRKREVRFWRRGSGYALR